MFKKKKVLPSYVTSTLLDLGCRSGTVTTGEELSPGGEIWDSHREEVQTSNLNPGGTLITFILGEFHGEAASTSSTYS